MKKLLSIILSVLMLVSAVSIIKPRSVEAASPYITEKTVLMSVGQTHTLKVKNEGTVKWTSSDKTVASVTKKGKVKALASGTTTITGKASGKSYKCKVTVSDGKKKSVVIYFSATGTTAAVAKKVAKLADADILRIQPKKKYTSADLNYDNDNSRATEEQNDDSARPDMATVVKNLSQYDTIYLGYCIWWGKEPKIMRTFMEKYSLSEKIVKPFCTSGSSGISGSMSNIKKFSDGADVKDGADLTDASVSEIKEWIGK